MLPVKGSLTQERQPVPNVRNNISSKTLTAKPVSTTALSVRTLRPAVDAWTASTSIPMKRGANHVLSTAKLAPQILTARSAANQPYGTLRIENATPVGKNFPIVPNVQTPKPALCAKRSISPTKTVSAKDVVTSTATNVKLRITV